VIKAYRLTKQRYQDTAMDGEGAARYGGRWNSPGQRVVYTSGSLALAMLEILVNLEDESTLHDAYVAFELSIPDELALYLDDALTEGWRENPPNAISRAIGDEWIISESSVVLAVPSAVIPLEYNFLVDPNHPDFGKIVVEGPFAVDVDPRLNKRPG